MDFLIYGVFGLSMLCIVAYFAIPVFRKLKENRKNGFLPSQAETESQPRQENDERTAGRD